MRLFLFAIGGTGSRVLKSMMMLSAAGLRPIGPDGSVIPDLEIVPVIIDPHRDNKDLQRTEALLNNYCEIRETLYKNSTEVKDGFFATRFVTLREIMSNTATTLTNTFIFNLSTIEGEKFGDYIHYHTMDEGNQALTSLLFAPYQLDNKMNIGFVGSPNIGSVALNQIKDSPEFKAFATVFAQGDRIFFISSIFGGTGAAGFPIMVKNIRQAANLDGIDNRDALRRAPIGGVPVLPYFTLQNNSADGRIATSDFIVKTQSALYYYKNTLTGANDSNVNKIFYVGDQVRSKPYAYDPGENGQRNNAHLVEMVAALAPFKFATLPENHLSDPNGFPLPTGAYEYTLDRDDNEVNFLSMGSETRHLIYKPLVKLHLLYIYLRTGIRDMIGRGYTEDAPKITNDLLASQFYRTLNNSFLQAYCDWLGEMYDNNRSVRLFAPGEINMTNVIEGVATRKGRLWGHKEVSNDLFNDTMNKLSQHSPTAYTSSTVGFKLLDLFNKAADKIIDDCYENIN